MSPLTDSNAYPVDVIDRHRFTLIAPFTEDSSRWYDLPFINIHDGRPYRLARPDRRLPTEACPQTYGAIVDRYRRHPEAKSLAPDGSACRADTTGLLQRTPVTAGELRRVGKETDRRWEQGEDVSLITATLVEFVPEETQRLTSDLTLTREVRSRSIRVLARVAEVSPTTVKAARRGERMRKATAQKLWNAIKNLP